MTDIEDDIEITIPEVDPNTNDDGKNEKIFYTHNVEQENRITSPILSEYEFSKVIGIRATQIENGGRIFTDYTGLTNPTHIAIKEFKEKKTPLILVRFIRNVNNIRYVERWDLSQMTCFE